MVLIYWILFLLFPGLLFLPNHDKFLSYFHKIVITLTLSTSFWIIEPWFVQIIYLKLNYVSLILQVIFILIFIFHKRAILLKILKHSIKNKIFDIFNVIKSEFPKPYWAVSILFIFAFGYFSVVFLFTLPPGCDISMHGYVTRLIFNQSGLPVTYRPILPVDYFGSYSSGYHCLTYFFSACSLESFLLGIQFVTGFSYFFCLLAIVFVFNALYDFSIAVVAGIACFAINHTISGTIGWGGIQQFWHLHFV